MAQSSSSQDLLNLLLRGGAGSSPRPADSLESQSRDQQPSVNPISPSRPAPRSSHSREATPSGPDTLEALFSSLRGSAPPNSNISPSAVSHAERQSSASQFQASTASPPNASTGALPGLMSASSPPLDNEQGRSLLLSMLNVRSPPSQEAGLAMPSFNNSTVQNQSTRSTSGDEQLQTDDGVQVTDQIGSEAAASPAISGSSAQVGATSLEDDGVPAQHGSDGAESTTAPAVDTSKPSQKNDLEAPLPESDQTVVREASPDGPDADAILALNSREIVAVEHLDSTNSDQPLSHPEILDVVPEASSEPPTGTEEDAVLEPLHELKVQTGPPSDTGEGFVQERVPISRFTSATQYTKGKQIAVNGLIAYGTRAGRVRVIDPDTGARLIKKLHNGLATDMDLSCEFQAEGQKMRRLATCYNNAIKVWEIPSSFDADDATNRVAYEFCLDRHIIIHSVLFSPSNAAHLAFTTSRSQEVYLIDLTEQISSENTPILVSAGHLKAFTVIKLSSPVSAVTWSPSGRALAGISLEGHLAFHLLDTSETRHLKLGKRDDALGPITQIELLQRPQDAQPVALLAISSRGLVIDVYTLSNTRRPASRVQLHTDRATGPSSPEQTFGRASLIPQHNSVLVSSSIEREIRAISYSLPQRLSALEHSAEYAMGFEGKSAGSEEESKTMGADLEGSPSFSELHTISTSHPVLQMVTAELNGKPGVFYLHSDGFEQISLDPAFCRPSDSSTANQPRTDPILANDAPIQSETPKSPLVNGDDFLQAFDRSVRELPQSSTAPLQNAEFVDSTPIMPPDSKPLAELPSTHIPHQVFQELLSQQNRIFSQMLAAQQEMHESRFQQLSKEIALLRDQRVDPFERVSRAIRTELRENLLPVIATALAEISSSPPSKQASAASPSSILSQQEQLLKRCTETMSQLFASFTRQLAPAITEALSGTLERHLANMIIRQAEQGDAIAQMRAIMLAEQMKREQLNTTLEADMQIIKAQLQNLTAQQRSVEITKPDRHVSNGGYPPLPSSGHDVAAGNVIGTANDPVPRLSRSNPSLDRPSTPSAAYEDMFLHALSRNPDPLKDLIDDAPLTRMDRVLPYDGQPRITAPAFLALCIRLAQDFDNDLATLDAGNERVRLAWILASLRAAKWAKGDPVLAAYLPRVFTQVMHSLNRRKQKLKKPEEREELSRALQMADELSGLW